MADDLTGSTHARMTAGPGGSRRSRRASSNGRSGWHVPFVGSLGSSAGLAVHTRMKHCHDEARHGSSQLSLRGSGVALIFAVQRKHGDNAIADGRRRVVGQLIRGRCELASRESYPGNNVFEVNWLDFVALPQRA